MPDEQARWAVSRVRDWFFPALEPAEKERRLYLLRTFLVVQTSAAVLLGATIAVDTWGSPHTVWLLAICLGGATLSIVSYPLARRVSFYGGAALLILTIACLIIFFVLFYSTRGPVPFLLIWPIMVAAILLSPVSAFSITTVVALAYAGLSFAEMYQVWALPLFRAELFAIWKHPEDGVIFQRVFSDTFDVVVVYYAAAFLSWIAARSLRQMAERAQRQATELDRYRAELEQRVAERTAELSRTLERLQSSVEMIREMGSPVLPILEGVILAPLIGVLDTARIQQVMAAILQGVARHHARMAILDITGVPLVDTAVANALVQTAQGVRLLGAVPVLVGIRAEVAHTMVDLGVDLRGIVTRATLREGLEYALAGT